MFNFAWQTERIAQARSNAIDQQIEADSSKFRKECKVLLLGSGKSDMSTFMKQMMIDHQNGFSRDELMAYRMPIYHNLVDSAQAVILAMRKISVDCEIPSNLMNCDRINDYRITLPTVPLKGPFATALSTNPLAPQPSEHTGNFVFDPEIASMIAQLWKDPTIAQVMDRSSEFDLMASTQYFFENAVRIGAPGYVPNESDVLRAREKSTGITETRFNMGQLCICMVDVSGLPWENKKWLHCFEGVTTLAFCISLSDYDQAHPEDPDTTRMAESLVLFDSIVNSPWLLRTSIILFLTGMEVFQAKIATVPLETYFPEYTGGPSHNKGVEYILGRFKQTNRGRLSIYPHLINADDTTSIRLVFDVVRCTVLQNALEDSGVLPHCTL